MLYQILFIVLATASLSFGDGGHKCCSKKGSKVTAVATCTGSKNCKACKNCKYCKHCSQRGKSCGVCR